MPTGGNAPECVVFDSEAAVAPLDLFFMLDSSGSMDFETQQPGLTKWQAIRNAFQAFATDPLSQGIGVALSFFPIIDFTEPELCSAVGPLCGTPSNCVDISVCSTGFNLCDTDQDCIDAGFPQDTCVPYGICQNAPQFGCLPTDPSFNCQSGTGPCIQGGLCWDHFTCDAGPYQSPIFGVAELPAGAATFINTIDGKTPDGATPTLPALQGAVDGAVSWANANPSHSVIVVLTTDGLPTVCDPDIEGPDPTLAIQNLANAAAVGAAQDVPTWVIGVFAPDEAVEATPNLDAIAVAGGTDEAFIIDSSGSVTQDFIAALNEVRANALSCEFQLLPGGDPLDWEDVWIRVTDNSMNELWIPRVDDEASCDAVTGGFHYDVAVGMGQTPSRIILCAASCAIINENPDQTIEVFSTCDDPPDN